VKGGESPPEVDCNSELSRVRKRALDPIAGGGEGKARAIKTREGEQVSCWGSSRCWKGEGKKDDWEEGGCGLLMNVEGVGKSAFGWGGEGGKKEMKASDCFKIRERERIYLKKKKKRKAGALLKDQGGKKEKTEDGNK